MRGDRRSDTLLIRIARAVWAGKWAVVVAVAATMLPAIALTLSHDQPYRAEARMLIRQLPSDVAEADEVDPQRRLSNEIAVLEGDEVAKRVRDTLGIGGDVPEADGYLSGDVDVIVVRVESPSAELAATLANAYAQAYITAQSERLTQILSTSIGDLEAQIESLQAQINALPTDDPQLKLLADEQSQATATLGMLTVDMAIAQSPAEVVEPASVPTGRIEPSLLRPLLLSLGVGLLIGAIGVVVMNHRAGEVRTAIDLSGLRSTEPLLAVVPNDRSSNSSPVVVRQPAGRAVDAYVELRAAVQRMVGERSVRVIQFSSPLDGEWATTTAVNLAVMLARSGTSVAVVDLDLRSPRVHTMLGLPRAPGVTEALADRRAGVDRLTAIERLARMDRYEDLDPVAAAPVDLIDPDDFGSVDELTPQPLSIVTSRFEDGLAVLTAGSPPRSALEVLSRRSMDDMIAKLRDMYELVIIASPATLSNGDASAIARHADGVVMVVKAGTCSLSVVRQALGAIDRAGSRILGVLLTGSKS